MLFAFGIGIRLRKCIFHVPRFVPFLYRRPGKLAFLALLASIETNNLRRINGLNSSTPAASTSSLVDPYCKTPTQPRKGWLGHTVQLFPSEQHAGCPPFRGSRMRGFHSHSLRYSHHRRKDLTPILSGTNCSFIVPRLSCRDGKPCLPTAAPRRSRDTEKFADPDSGDNLSRDALPAEKSPKPGIALAGRLPILARAGAKSQPRGWTYN